MSTDHKRLLLQNSLLADGAAKDSKDDELLFDEMEDRKSRYSFSSVLSVSDISNSAALTTFLLLNTMIGSGILNQPYVFYQSGLLGGLGGFIVASLATWGALQLMTAAGLHENVLEYSGLAKKVFGKKGEYAVDVSIILMTLGAQIGYILVVGETTSQLLQAWGCDSPICGQFLTTIIAVVGFITPICMFRHFGHLAYLSLFSILAIVLCLMLVVVGGPIQHKPLQGDEIRLFSFTGTLSSIGSIVFSLSCTSANFQAFISTEKDSQNLSSWYKITFNAVFAGAAMCVAMGIGGYLSFGSGTNGEILS